MKRLALHWQAVLAIPEGRGFAFSSCQLVRMLAGTWKLARSKISKASALNRNSRRIIFVTAVNLCALEDGGQQ